MSEPFDLLQAMLDVEAALAEAEAEVGVIPHDAVQPIRSAARAERYDLATLAAEAEADGVLTIALVRHLTNQVEALNRDAARYVHWGATSQDILDTARVLQLQRTVPRILADL